MIVDLVSDLREMTASLPPLLQWLAVMLAGALPFIESYYGSVMGIAAGVPPLVAVAAAIIGNIASTLGCIAGAARFRRRRAAHPPSASRRTQPQIESARRARLRERFDKYGVVGVSLTSQAILPSQITSVMMIGMGAPVWRVAAWQCISICLWGVAYGSLAALGVTLLTS